MSFGRANLFFDQIEVVEQPFPGRRNPTIRHDRLHQQAAGSGQDAFILGQSRQELIRRISRAQFVQARQGPAMLLHLIAAEQFRSQRWLADGVLFCQTVSAETRPQMGQNPGKGLSV
jgi:hypothetical protein